MAEKKDTALLRKSDQELVFLTLKDKDYYRPIVERYKQSLVGYIQRLSRLQLADAKDILQEVFIRAYRNLNAYNPDLKFSSWLYRIAHNETVSYIRKLKDRPQTIDFETNHVFMETVESDINLAAEIDKNFLKDHIKILLGKLDSKYRVVLILRYMEEKDYEEISDILQKPMGTIATLLSRAKENFRKEILSDREKNLF